MSEANAVSAAPAELYARFLKEFRQAARGVRRTRLATAVGLMAGTMAVAVSAVAAVDYLVPMPLLVRQGCLAFGLVALLVWLMRCRSDHRWSVVERGTVDEIEQAFPELGQRVRTAVQFGGMNDAAVARRGVAPNLLEAMRAELDRRSSPMDLARVIPVRRTMGALVVGAVVLMGVWLSTFLKWDWNLAVARALGGTSPYTVLAVETKDVVVEERATFRPEFAVTGRCPPTIVVQSRPADRPEAEWREWEVRAESGQFVAAANRWSPPARRFRVSLGTVTDPLVWRVIAGGETSPVYRVGVRYPLSIRGIRVEVTPPEYTRLPMRVFDEGSLTGLVGSLARFTVELDNPAVSVTLHTEPLITRGDDAPAWSSPPVRVEDRRISFETRLTEGFDWWLEARGSEGVLLPRRDFRVRTQSDEPPKIVFEFPGERYDVHPLAEIPMKLKVTDDYGLARAGVVFQINNDEEQTLIEQEFPVDDVMADGAITLPRTRAILEKMLALEDLALSQRDCIAYYAWAEDNRPGETQRTETELRYLDLRPFRQIFLLPPETMNSGGGGMDFTFGRRLTLDEIIERQRTIINRTIGLTRRIDSTDRELSTIDRLTVAQNRLASATRELATFFTEEEFDGADMLFQAEASMLSAIDSISVASYDRAVLQERDAQQFLVEARNRIRLALQDPRNNARLPRIRRFERQLSQKLRRPRRDRQQEETVQTLITALRKLADDQRATAQQLIALDKAAESDKRPDGDGAKPPAEDQPAKPVSQPQGDGTPTPAGEQPAGDKPAKSLAEQREELIDRMADALADAREIEPVIDREPSMTELAKDRIKAAVARMEAASRSLESGARPGIVSEEAAESADQLDELAVQLFALAREELTEQLASARDLATSLADEQRSALPRFGSGRDEYATPDTRTTMPPDAGEWRELTKSARRLTEQARTLEDVLTHLSKSDTPEGGDTIDQVSDLLKNPDVSGMTKGFETQARRLEQQAAANGRPQASPEQAKGERELADAADRTAMTLERLYRSLVMPRIELLRTMQANAVRLETAGGGGEATATENVGGWTREVDELLEQAEAMGVGGEALAAAREGNGASSDQQMQRTHETTATNAETSRSSLLSTSRGRALRVVIEDLERRIQETILADVEQLGTEATPPQYESQVEQYLKILGRVRGDEQPNR